MKSIKEIEVNLNYYKKNLKGRSELMILISKRLWIRSQMSKQLY